MKRLKNTINIPQAQVMKHFGGKVFESRKDIKSHLDLIDMCIYDFFYGYMHSKSKKIIKITFEGEIYYWAAYSMILRELPLLKIKKDALRCRINKLINAKLIKKHVAKVLLKTIIIDGCFYTLGEKSDYLHYTYYNKQEDSLDSKQGGGLTQNNTKDKASDSLSIDLKQDNMIVCKETDILGGIYKDINKSKEELKEIEDDDPLSAEVE